MEEDSGYKGMDKNKGESRNLWRKIKRRMEENRKEDNMKFKENGGE